LHDPRQALLELSKGRLTSDPSHHTGHGIFFTSSMFDEFSIYSGDLFYNRVRQEDDDWLIESRDLPEIVSGTNDLGEIPAFYKPIVIFLPDTVIEQVTRIDAEFVKHTGGKENTVPRMMTRI